MAVPEEQQLYARWLDVASRVGLAVLAAMFLVYVFKLVPAHVPVEDLPALWTLPLEQYLEQTGAPTGWGWLTLLGRGEYLSLIGVTILCLATLLCYVRLVIALVAKGDRLYAAIAAAQIVVLCVAALGFLAGGH
ncbi:MAG TPA: hypothetical protein VK043_04315 [Burkholderiales bacterium]|nr:hypothetical protein [Burkholderiales bacterium]